MSWEIIAIWLIVAATLVLFVNSEKRRKFASLTAKAQRYATAPQYRHRGTTAVADIAPPPYVPVGLSPADRLFLQKLAELSRRRT